jgi:hypothetical protein
MDERDWLAERFQEHRPRLRAVAYRSRKTRREEPLGAPTRQPRTRPHPRCGHEPDADQAAQQEVVEAFLAAARDGDFDALVAVLDPARLARVDLTAFDSRG